MNSQKITDKDEIKRILKLYMLNYNEQKAPFLMSIFTREHREGGIIYEGCRPIGSSTDETDTRYSIANTDSNYTRSISHISLSFIEYIEILG